MGDSAKKENDSIRFDSMPQTSRFDSIRSDSLLCQNPLHTPQSTPGVLDFGPKAAGPVNRSHDRPARIVYYYYCRALKASEVLVADGHNSQRPWATLTVSSKSLKVNNKIKKEIQHTIHNERL